MHDVAIAERLLTARFGAGVRLHGGTVLHSSNRTQVSRYLLESPAAQAPPSVIVKQAAAAALPEFDGSVDGNLYNDWAGLLAGREALHGSARVPRVYGADARVPLLVLEDLGATPTLRDVLGGDAVAASQALMSVFTALGRLHAAGAGSSFVVQRLPLAPYQPEREWYARRFGRTPAALRGMLAALEVRAAPGTECEIVHLVEHLAAPGAFATLLHGDPAPTNLLLLGTHVGLIDWEYATVGPALVEGVQARMGFPTGGYSGALPPHIVQAVESAYRHTLSTGCPQAADEREWRRGQIAACAYWAINVVAWLPFAALLERDHTWGNSTVRRRAIARAAALVEVIEQAGVYPALGATFAALSRRMVNLWPQAAAGVARYPAFRS